jgi:predicted lactoylglutathione lyase
MSAADWDWTRIVFDHVQIGVRDRDASKSFYAAVLAPLGIPIVWEGADYTQFANLALADREPTEAIHIAFSARSREEVDAFHRAGVEAGHRDNGGPGIREQYSSDVGGRYYAAYLLDPDGNNVEAVYREF